MKLIDISSHNIGEAIFKDGKVIGTRYHDFDWKKARANGIEGAIIKSSQGLYKDVGFDILSKSCDLPHKTSYHFIDYCRNNYSIGQEIQFGQRQAQKHLEVTSKWPHDLKEAYDGEQNAFWEKLDNTKETNYALIRFLIISLAAVREHFRLTGYWPMFYTNAWLTQFMKDFVQCPLWISSPLPGGLYYYNWKSYAIRQISWTGSGAIYGNYPGNPYVDINLLNGAIETLYRNPGAVVTPPVVVPVPVPSPLPEPVPGEGAELVFAGSRSVAVGSVSAPAGLLVRSEPKKRSGNETGIKLADKKAVDILGIVEDGQDLWAQVGLHQYAAIRYGGERYIK